MKVENCVDCHVRLTPENTAQRARVDSQPFFCEECWEKEEIRMARAAAAAMKEGVSG